MRPLQPRIRSTPAVEIEGSKAWERNPYTTTQDTPLQPRIRSTPAATEKGERIVSVHRPFNFVMWQSEGASHVEAIAEAVAS